ncbi:hemoglobin/transferrin/lactoferrin receptor protein [Allopseudospirillum japonicum]|uniref:Hemoglobin/transferrin/lactoferrin receptor protein n=1 Tax=Allopseudospirillum japonicum TaxID=64971 RepID=A0A1H6SKV7_9GAMM|nr:TonB-dependent receptor plug domain-containing protein [Allopseudospirillum japonicum]SEI66524.1 hemoglobin/transferrin/lactoferrin receptor protein [Allopseudospirillum japonicum]
MSHTSTFFYYLSSSLYFCALAPMGWAHEGGHTPDELATLNIPVIQVKGQVETDPFVKTLDTEYLSRSLAQDLQDSFKLDPAVQVGTGSRNGQKIFLRGIEDLHLNIQIDGARQGGNVFHHQARLQIDPFLMKQVRVFTGPAQADAGPGALGGSVVLETLDAQDLLQGRALGARVSTHYESSSDLFGGITAAYGQLSDHLGILAYARKNSNNEVRAGGGDSMVSTDGQHDNYLLKASLLDLAE